MNAALMPLADKVVSAFQAAFEALALTCPLFLSQNDGTLMAAPYARRYPVFTFSSGPTNSMRGASYLTGRPDAMVVDVGGTTSDIGMLMGGFPRPSGSAVSIGGVLTNFRMPDVLAIGLGGGTLVKDGGQKVGPQSVGWRLPQKGMVFGGDTLTATDIAVATQQADIGDRSLVKAVPSDTLKGALEQMRAMLSRGVDAMKTSAEPLPLIVVGGGGFLVPGDLPGISETLRPNSAGVANAIGAAFAQVGGEADAIYTLSTQSREDALAGAKAKARERASAAGALAGSIKIVDVEETPMSYMAEPGAVIRVKAIGDADLARLTRQSS